MTAKMAAGILPFFDDGKTVLLGKEYRSNKNIYAWMEFGGKKENNETLAETACRETNEETGFTLRVTTEQVLYAERNGHYIEYYNEKSNTFYRMYCVIFDVEKPTIETFEKNSLNKDYVEKVAWQYFKAKDVIYNQDGNLPRTTVKLYDTMRIRLAKLRDAEFLKYWLK